MWQLRKSECKTRACTCTHRSRSKESRYWALWDRWLMLGVTLHIHPSPAKAEIQYFGVETLFMPGFHWKLAPCSFCFWQKHSGLSVCSGPGPVVGFRSLACSLGFGCISVKQIIYVKTCMQIWGLGNRQKISAFGPKFKSLGGTRVTP